MDEVEIKKSPLCRRITRDGTSVDVLIYSDGMSTMSLQISLALAGQASTIRFVAVHLEDLRAVLELEDTAQGHA